MNQASWHQWVDEVRSWSPKFFPIPILSKRVVCNFIGKQNDPLTSMLQIMESNN